MASGNDQILRKNLVELINAGNAHATLAHALKGLPAAHRGIKPDNLPYSIWQLLAHIRIAQWDILEFCRSPNHQSPKWPDEYWPKESAPASDAEWDETIAQIKSDSESFIAILNGPQTDLYKPFPHGGGQNLLREAMLIGAHGSYHTAEIIMIRRLLDDWKK